MFPEVLLLSILLMNTAGMLMVRLLPLCLGEQLPITYTWSNTMTTQTITGLPAGNYSVSVSDANGCTASATIVVNNIAGPSAPLSNIINDNCTYGIGSVTVSPVNGTPPYTYLWSNAAVTQTISNLYAGVYGITVTDANNCTAVNSVTITDAPSPTLSFTSTPSSCGQSDGSATVTAVGGSGTYTYLWSNGGVMQTINNVAAGNYSVVVDDGTCTVTGNIAVIDQPGPTASFNVNPDHLTADNAITNIGDNSINAVQWAWDFGDGTTATGMVSNHTYTNTGTFVITLTVTDANGCTSTTSQTVIVQPVFTIYIPNSFTPNGDGHNDVFAPTGVNIDMNTFTMYIYDRWGEEVYKTKDLSKPWNGSKDNTGDKIVFDVYVYRILVSELTGIKHEYLGRVTLLP
jgi:gliding motility-associated-like protein